MTPRESFEQVNYIIKELGSGFWGDVYASIPKQTADNIILKLPRYQTRRTTLTAKTQLKAAMEAGKIFKAKIKGQVQKGDGGKREIEILRLLQVGNFPGIVKLKAADPLNWWYTLDIFTGGTVEDFSKHFHSEARMDQLFDQGLGVPLPGHEDPPAGLGWHIMLQLAEALLAIHFGYKGNAGLSNSRFAHLDFCGPNFMLRPDGVYRDYPDLIVIDFGNAYEVQDATESLEDLSEELGPFDVTDQCQDLRRLEGTLDNVFDTVFTASDQFWVVCDRIREFEVDKEFKVDKDKVTAEKSLFRFLIQLRDEAVEMREKTYQPLGPKVVKYFQDRKEAVSDEDLKKVFPDLV